MKEKFAELKEMASLWFWVMGLLWQSHKPAMIALSFATMAQAFVGLGQLWVAKLLVDQIVIFLSLPPDVQTTQFVYDILWYVGLEASLLLAGIITITISGHSFNVLSEHFSFNIRFKILAKAARLDFASYESANYYDQLQRAQREAGLGPAQLLRRIMDSAQATFGLLSIAGLIFWYNPVLILILIISTIPSFYIASTFGRKRFVLFDGRTPDGRRANYLSQILSSDVHAKEVRIWGLENYLTKQVKNLFLRFKHENIDLSLKESVVGFVGEFVATLGYYASYVIVVLGVLSYQLTVGDLTLYAGAFSRLQSYFDQVFHSIARTYEALLFAENLKIFFSFSPSVTSPENPTSMPMEIDSIEVKDVDFVYPETKRVVLNKLNFTINRGECVAIVGVNGAGKTSLVKLLLRLYDPTSGSIRVNGTDIRNFDLDEWRRNVGIVFQDYVKYQLSLQENIGFGRIDDIENVEMIHEAAEKAGIDYLSVRMPEGYEALLGRRFAGGREISIGQWQRIALARALLRDAPFLILDEPSASLDAQAEYELYSQLKALAEDRMTILISHRFSTVRMADRILVMKNGEIIEQGTHEGLLAKETEYARLFKLQAKNYQTTSSNGVATI